MNPYANYPNQPDALYSTHPQPNPPLHQNQMNMPWNNLFAQPFNQPPGSFQSETHLQGQNFQPQPMQHQKQNQPINMGQAGTNGQENHPAWTEQPKTSTDNFSNGIQVEQQQFVNQPPPAQQLHPAHFHQNMQFPQPPQLQNNNFNQLGQNGIDTILPQVQQQQKYPEAPPALGPSSHEQFAPSQQQPHHHQHMGHGAAAQNFPKAHETPQNPMWSHQSSSQASSNGQGVPEQPQGPPKHHQYNQMEQTAITAQALPNQNQHHPWPAQGVFPGSHIPAQQQPVSQQQHIQQQQHQHHVGQFRIPPAHSQPRPLQKTQQKPQLQQPHVQQQNPNQMPQTAINAPFPLQYPAWPWPMLPPPMLPPSVPFGPFMPPPYFYGYPYGWPAPPTNMSASNMFQTRGGCRKFTDKQYAALKKRFSKSKEITDEECAELGYKINLGMVQIKKWFLRNKERAESIAAKNRVEKDHDDTLTE
ncbi:hypothetical protein L3Y34_013895 [Caenorhabditis briggsae]|uniref:Homeobox domain-containing protein n=1 Tax=Caenorhabditis briggsae TaxID=6238 RepID=A0AAE9A2N8_CAEBR|nr:hypothetical protein L3Y34_013885 [Caenorhabditis briggsae]ULT85377.1 hypothetical protein L3Y34_013895 [Caenorhabditis briggsae]